MVSFDGQRLATSDQGVGKGYLYLLELALTEAFSEKQRLAEMGERGHGGTKYIPGGLAWIMDQVRTI